MFARILQRPNSGATRTVVLLGAFQTIKARNGATSQAGGLVSTRGFVIDPTNKHHLREVLQKQAQDTGVSALRRQCEEDEATAVLLEGEKAVDWLPRHADPPFSPPTVEDTLTHRQQPAA